MPAPINPLKAALERGDVLTGLWLALASAEVAEIAGQAGFDWCLIDGEHGPNTLQTISAQLRALAGGPCQPVLRLPAGEDWMIKQALDLGVQTLVIPMVHTADDAKRLVKATQYPPRGTRGMGAALARASQYGQITDYGASANDQICLFVQIESVLGLENVEEIASIEGVHGLFAGPADLSADMGFPGNPAAPEVQRALNNIYAAARSHGKFAGTITFDTSDISRQVEKGVQFLGVGGDAMIMAQAFRNLARITKASASSGN